MSDDDFFKQAMADVSPIKQDKVTASKPKNQPDPGTQYRRESAEKEAESEDKLSDHDGLAKVGPHDIISFKRGGVQNGVFRNLRLGKYQVEAALDLHRLTVQQARRELHSFIKEARRLELRTVLVTHGKGDKSPEPAKLKSFVNIWLPEFDEVMAFHSAQKSDGGTGSVYVLLRKGEKKKLLNRERYG